MLKGLKAWLDGLLSWLRSPPSLPAENRDRSAVCYEVTYLPTGDEFRVVSIHSPSSDDWDTLTQHKKETIFRNCVQQARGRSKSAGSLDATPCMWILCEDLNTDAESLFPQTCFSIWGSHLGYFRIGNECSAPKVVCTFEPICGFPWLPVAPPVRDVPLQK